jgi:hypothetical protein
VAVAEDVAAVEVDAEEPHVMIAIATLVSAMCLANLNFLNHG